MSGGRALLAVSALLVGCSPLAPRPDPTRFFVLAPTADGLAASPRPRFSLGIGPVTLPAYLRRPQMVIRVAPNRVEIAEFARWAEPLEGAFGRVLAANLERLLGSGRVLVFPWVGTAPPAHAIQVDVQRFESAADGTAELAARWTIRGRPGDGALAEGASTVREPAPPGDTDASVAALSRAVATLGRELAAAVERLSPPP